MNFNSLVFSNNPKFRITRHVLFWSIWILYDTFFLALSWSSKYPFQRAFWPSLFVEILSFPLDIAFCYLLIYFLIPRFLYNGKYIVMILLWLAACFCYTLCFRLYIAHINPLIYSAYNMPYQMHSMSFIWDFFNLFSQINMEGCMAAAIKLGKMWYVKHQELDLVKKEKLKTESETKTNDYIQPFFLVNTLDKLETLSQRRPEVVSSMIQKTKKLMEYVMYECNQSKVSLKKELDLVSQYIELTKTASVECIDVIVKLPEHVSNEKIAPFIILPLVENSFRQLSMIDMPRKSMRLEARLYAGNFVMTIAWSKPVDTSTLYNGSNASLNMISKRLNLLYPQSHKIKVIIKPDEFLVNMKIDLDAAIN